MVIVTDYTVGQAAQALGITPRTLRHWDQIGLLVPQWRTMGDYRLYTDADMDRALRILAYRAAGVPLATIAELLADASPSARRAQLLHQRDVLQQQVGHLSRMIEAVDTLLQEEDMSTVDKCELFGSTWPDFEEEAHDRWGDTPEWEQSQQRMAGMKTDDWQAVKAQWDQLKADIAELAEQSSALVDRHRGLIEQFYEASPSKQVCLARMYCGDDRWADSLGTASQRAFLRAVVEWRAAQEGVDLDDVSWE